MTDAPLNQKGCIGKSTPAPHLAGGRRRKGKGVPWIDAGPQGSAVGWRIGPRAAVADAARSGRQVADVDDTGIAAREVPHDGGATP